MPKNEAEVFLDIHSNPYDIMIDNLKVVNIQTTHPKNWLIYFKPTLPNNNPFVERLWDNTYLINVVLGCVLWSDEEKRLAARMPKETAFYFVGDFLKHIPTTDRRINVSRYIPVLKNCKFFDN